MNLKKIDKKLLDWIRFSSSNDEISKEIESSSMNVASGSSHEPDNMMMSSLEKISYYVKFLDKVQDNLEKGGCYMQIVIDAKISIQNKKNVNGMKTWELKSRQL